MELDGTRETEGRTTVRFMSGMLLPGLPSSITLQLAEPVTISELFQRLEEVVSVPGLRDRVSECLAVLVDGTSIQHLAGWDTVVRPGAAVSVVLPMGGG